MPATALRQSSWSQSSAMQEIGARLTRRVEVKVATEIFIAANLARALVMRF